jgi:hypothetical protein
MNSNVVIKKIEKSYDILEMKSRLCCLKKYMTKLRNEDQGKLRNETHRPSKDQENTRNEPIKICHLFL